MIVAAWVGSGLLALVGCSQGPQCYLDGIEHPINQPFMMTGCGVCMCDAFGDLQCSNPACSGPGHQTNGVAGASGSHPEAGADASSSDASDGPDEAGDASSSDSD